MGIIQKEGMTTPQHTPHPTELTLTSNFFDFYKIEMMILILWSC